MFEKSIQQTVAQDLSLIEILTEADYFTVGLIFNSYLNVGLYVSSFNVYFEYFA
jgi:hypothetical protein